MCDIAPFQMKCVYEDFDLTVCAVNKLCFALTELKQNIPFLGKYTSEYKCQHFEVFRESEKKTMIRLDRFPDKDAAIEYLRSEVLRSKMGCATKKDAEKYLMKHIPKEPYYQTKIINFLKNTYQNAVVWKEAAGAYSQQGIPDVTFIKDGRYYGFEVKRPYFGVLSKIQKQTIEKIRAAGGIAEVVTFPEEVQKIVEGYR